MYLHHIILHNHPQGKRLKGNTLTRIGHVRTQRYALRPDSAPSTEMAWTIAHRVGQNGNPKNQNSDNRDCAAFFGS